MESNKPLTLQECKDKIALQMFNCYDDTARYRVPANSYLSMVDAAAELYASQNHTPDTGIIDEVNWDEIWKELDKMYPRAEYIPQIYDTVELIKNTLSRLPVSGESAGEEKKGKGFNDTCQRCGSKFDDVLGIGHCYKCSK